MKMSFLKKAIGLPLMCAGYIMCGGGGSSSSLPTVETDEIAGNLKLSVTIGGEYSDGSATAKGGGTLVSQGASAVKDCGVCWSKTADPTIDDSKASDGYAVAIGVPFSNALMHNLDNNTVYHVRAYATNNEGTGYGEDVSFNSGIKCGETETAVTGGGYVFYNDGTGHGLVCWTSNESTNACVWSNVSTAIGSGARNTAIGTGAANTDAIISQPSHTASAAKLCRDRGAGWFLPSKDELDLMYKNLWAHAKGNLMGAYFWSSTEIDATTSWNDFFYSGSWKVYAKDTLHSVRAVHAF